MKNRRSLLKSLFLTVAGVTLAPTLAAASAGGKFEVTKTDAEWKRLLKPQQYYVLREHGT